MVRRRPNKKNVAQVDSSGVALIYVRVSSERQAREGHGLDSQEQRCAEYARQKGYQVAKVFQDSASGGGDFWNRPGMTALLKYLDDNAHTNYIVIFDDLKRFARDTAFHLKLRQEFNARLASVECLNFTFENTPEGNFIETVLAAQGELERKQNRRQVMQKMRARLEKGYWTFGPILGFTSRKDTHHGKLLVPKPEMKPHISAAIEGYALGRFITVAEVCRFLNKSGMKRSAISHDRAQKMIQDAWIYAGWMAYAPWGITPRPGHHEALISREVAQKAIEKLEGKMTTRQRVDEHPDFPARGYVKCADCGKTMTASWTTKPKKNYRLALYRCINKKCVRHNKSTRADKFDERMKKLLLSLEPKEGTKALLRAVFEKKWANRTQEVQMTKDALVHRLDEVAREKDQLLDRIGKVTSDVVAKSIEEKIEKLVQEEEALKPKITKIEEKLASFGTAFDVVMDFVESPYFTWEKGNLKRKRLLLRAAFPSGLPYHFENGFGTAELSCVLKVFQQIESSNTQHVEMGGIEPPSGRGIMMGLRRVVRLGVSRQEGEANEISHL